MKDCLNNLLAQFDKLYPWSLKKSTSEDQKERKNDKFETPTGIKKKIQDSETQKSPEKETSRHIKNAYEISRSGQILQDQRFSRDHSISLLCDRWICNSYNFTCNYYNCVTTIASRNSHIFSSVTVI